MHPLDSAVDILNEYKNNLSYLFAPEIVQEKVLEIEKAIGKVEEVMGDRAYY